MALKVRLIIVFSLVLMGVAAIAPGAQAATAGRLAVSALKFSPTSVNASTGTASATLTWTVTDSDASAGDIAGEVDIRQEGQRPGSYVGIAVATPLGTYPGQIAGESACLRAFADSYAPACQ